MYRTDRDEQVSRLVGIAAGVLLFGVAALAGQSALAKSGSGCSGSGGYYTHAQAAHGTKVFNANCSSCHGANLKGNAGPPLTGKQFKSYLNFSKISGPQLLDFITSQMPYNNPGSLKEGQYLAALAHIFQTDGYPSGNKPLTKARLKCLKLLPYPNSGNGD